jgi:predicted TIM-barrel fold metal-dependent hydrolase
MINPSPTRVADVWANLWDASFFAAQPTMRALYERLGMESRAGVTLDMMTREADAGGVRKIVVSATDFPGTPVDNRVVAAFVARDPGRLVGCASIDPRRGMEGVREFRRAIADDGLRGLKLLPFLYDLPPNDARYFPLYAACVDLAVPALVLTGHTAVQARSEVGRPLHLDDVALHFPDLVIIAGHAGYPWTDELISLAWKHPNFYIDTSGHRPKYLPPPLKHFLNSFGRNKVMFGTGYPFMDYATPIEEARSMDLRPEALSRFLWENAARIWGWS